jgi:RimJ/RimL family protein N-acetyltransferase
MTETHREALRAACAEDPDLWQIYYADFSPPAFDSSFDELMAREGWHRFALFNGDNFAGMSCFLNIDPSRQTLEIGSTYYRPALRGTGFNRRVKAMMLARAFATGIRRVEFRVDSRNARSQAAMMRLGATREGVMRADRITWNNVVRDTVLFSILRDEWR